MQLNRLPCFLAMVVAMGCSLYLTPAVLADGWHNASLRTGSLDEWLNDLERNVPEVADRLDQSSIRSGTDPKELERLAREAAAGNRPQEKPLGRGGKQLANLSDQQRALLGRKAKDCLEIMAYMDDKNIIPTEFPKFNLSEIPAYRKNAKQLLNAMGSVGSDVVVEKVRSHLMGNLPSNTRDLSPHPSYFPDLIQVLKDSAAQGDLSAEDFQTLLEASQGEKPPAVAALAAKLDEVFAEVDIPTLLAWLDEAPDQAAKVRLQSYLKARIENAGKSELIAALNYEGLDKETRTKVANALKSDLPQMNVVELLSMMDADIGQPLQRAAALELQQRRPTYSDVQAQIPQIYQFTQSESELVVRFASWHMTNAFQRAPMLHCIYWLGQGNQELNKIIWKQVDARIARADAPRRGSYFKIAAAVLKHKGATQASKVAALTLFVKLNDQQAVDPILDQLALMPRDLWPHAGQALASLTGQDFGPKQGDGVAEVSVALKKWRKWWNDNQ